MSAAPLCDLCSKPIEGEPHDVLVCSHDGPCGCPPVPVHSDCCPRCQDAAPLAPVVDLDSRRKAVVA